MLPCDIWQNNQIINKYTMITAKYFQEKEFNNCNPSCSLQDMSQEFMNVLDRIRETAGIPLVINCAYRTPEHEKKQGRAGTSAHTLGCAGDIRCSNSRTRFLLIEAAIKCGVKRIGISKVGNYIHIDTSKQHEELVIWLY